MECYRMRFFALMSLVSICAAFLMLASPALAQVEPSIVFGPKRFDKPKGSPVTYSETVTTSFPAGNYLLWVESGADGLQQVKNVSVSVNGVEVIDSAALRSANPAMKPVLLQPENTLTVTLKGQGGNFITVKVLCEGCSPIRITSPAEGETINAPFVTVKGEVANPSGAEVGVMVNGVTALVSGTQFIANHVPLAEGWAPITGVLTDAQGNNTQTAIQVLREREPQYIALSADPESGILPLEVRFHAEAGLPATVATTSLACNGPETPAVVQTGQEEFAAAFARPGLYTCTLNATDVQGGAWEDSVGINVLSKEALDGLLHAKWSGMKEALAAGEIEKAVGFFAEISRNSYRQQFTLLTKVLPQIVDDMGAATQIRAEGNRAVYDLRTIRNGETYSFQLEFIRDGDGIWRIKNL